MQMEDCSFPDAVRLLAQRAGITVEPPPSTPAEKLKAQARENLQEMYSLAQKYYQALLWRSPEGKEVLTYLQRRGLTKESILEFQLGYAGNNWQGLTGELRKKGYDLQLALTGGLLGKSSTGRYYDYFRERLIFPIWDSQGSCSCFRRPYFGPGGPNANSRNRRCLTKQDSLRLSPGTTTHPQEKKALLVEGYMDVILLHQWD